MLVKHGNQHTPFTVFTGAWVHPWFLVGSVLLIFLVFCVVFLVGSVLLIFLVFCVVFCSFSYCVLCAQCCQFLWIVHSLLPLRFSLTFIFKLEQNVVSSTNKTDCLKITETLLEVALNTINQNQAYD